MSKKDLSFSEALQLIEVGEELSRPSTQIKVKMIDGAIMASNAEFSWHWIPNQDALLAKDWYVVTPEILA